MPCASTAPEPMSDVAALEERLVQSWRKRGFEADNARFPMRQCVFAAEYPPLIGREMWVEVNVTQIRNMGAEGWLRQLLDVLGGDIVTAEDVGFAPPGSTFGYGGSGRSSAQWRGKKTR